MKLLPNHGPWCSASKKFLKREGDVIVPLRLTSDFAMTLFMSGINVNVKWLGLQAMPDGTVALMCKEADQQGFITDEEIAAFLASADEDDD